MLKRILCFFGWHGEGNLKREQCRRSDGRLTWGWKFTCANCGRSWVED